MIHHTISGKSTPLDCLIIPVFEDKPIDATTKNLPVFQDGSFDHIQTLKDFEAKRLEVSLLYTKDPNAPRVLFVGLGKYAGFTIRAWKHALGAAVIAAQGKKAARIGCVIPFPAVQQFGAKKLGIETVCAIEMASYAFDEMKSDQKARVKPIERVSYIGLNARHARQFVVGVEEGARIGASVNFTRRLGNTPPTIMTPAFLAKTAQGLAKEFSSIKTTVFGRPEIKKHNMGCLLGVSSGSQHEPKFIIIEYHGGKKSEKPIVLIGKGITFDSGGLSLKPMEFLMNMKFDMLGAATVLGTIRAAAALKIKKNIICLIPSCENMPGGEAYRPDDILVNMEGKTVEIQNTDAEGRLILCEALSWAKQYKPKEVIDFATLTGACMIALGNERSGLFSPVEKLADRLQNASEAVGEQLWRLPLGEEYSEAIKSMVADLKNIGGVGNDRYGGASVGAAFLQHFTLDEKGEPSYPWAHIDMSSSYYSGATKSWIRWGANGFGVQTMVEFLRG